MMATPSSLILLLLLLLLVIVVVVLDASSEQQQLNTSTSTRDDFPSDFVFGAGTSAYQVEGAVAEDGRTPSVWDVFTHAGNMVDNSTADIAAGGYHKYKECSICQALPYFEEDVKMMSDIGLEAYRFSISWSRILPYGRGFVNVKGLEYYNNLIDELVSNGIEPHVTIYHLDLPQILEEEYGGWLSPRIIGDFTAYADVCFKEFGDRVFHWTTLNEPNIMTVGSYSTGQWPPQRCSLSGGFSNCKGGNSTTEPYVAMHHLLLAHASAVEMYREKYQAKQNGLIGMNMFAFWCAPMTGSNADIEAAKVAMDFYTGWAVNPLVFGDYPEIMKKNIGSRIPSFTKRESKLLKGSFDFIGLNHYFTVYVKNNPYSSGKIVPVDYYSDMGVIFSFTTDGTPAGPIPLSTPYNPFGMRNLLDYFKDNYGNPPLYIHENGFVTPHNETLDDTDRIHYISGYIESMLEAIRNGSNARGYFVWSFVDVFEVLTGYQSRYGIVHVDFEDKDLKRRPKSSAKWYSNFINKNEVVMKNSVNDGWNSN